METWFFCINQFLGDISKSFDEGLEGKVVILHSLKSFDEGRPEGLLLKLKQNGISANPSTAAIACPRYLNLWWEIKYKKEQN